MSMYLKIENPPEEVKYDLEEHYRDRERRVHDSIHRLIEETRKLPDELGKRRFTEGQHSRMALLRIFRRHRRSNEHVK